MVYNSNIFFESIKDSIFYGAVAQLVECMDGIHEVTGSIPVSSTSLRVKLLWLDKCFSQMNDIDKKIEAKVGVPP